jgi:uncharacterized protein YciW
VRSLSQLSYESLFQPDDSSRLSAHERLSVALRVAELNEVPGLALHYREKLASAAPAEGVSGRLFEILRHTDLVTLYPVRTVSAALAKLSRYGLTESEIVTLSQIIAFVAYQARIIAVLCLTD